MIRTVNDLPDVPEFARGDVHRYEPPELGWSVPYSTEAGLTATVYIYPCPRPAGVDGDVSVIAAAAFESAKGDLFKAARAGIYREVVLLGKSPGRVDAARLGQGTLHVSFIIRRDEGSLFSELILNIHAGNCVKLRCTYPPNRHRYHGGALNRLLDVLGKALRVESGATG